MVKPSLLKAALYIALCLSVLSVCPVQARNLKQKAAKSSNLVYKFRMIIVTLFTICHSKFGLKQLEFLGYLALKTG